MDLSFFHHPSGHLSEDSTESANDESMELDTSSASGFVSNQSSDEIENFDFDTPPSSPTLNNTTDQDPDCDLDTPPPSPHSKVDDVICLSGNKDFAAHKPKNNWDSL